MRESVLGSFFSLLIFPAVLAVPVWVIAVAFKLISVAAPGRRPDWRQDLLRWSVWMTGSGAVILYVLGAGAVGLAVHESSSGADSTPSQECRDDYRADHLVGQTASYVPLRFDCVLDDGGTYPSSPAYAWINALVAALGLATIALVVAKGYGAERRARADAAGGER
ncbi:hypothetical protein J2Z21_001207 [Streptomyces griseochromogenes]|uniref:Uncharacterized protein n=1 Tax=Streptomyces griseochromogenes TaxID=68214 RepID=A0A1B1AU87_9ACTN|nr:hypothetical protein [Streptomyces griseochromogenes]ANP50092.1 hypothetical protein AVL59_11140 [Streptomyces griseochromogenes]MBP2048283.1 hypothetical protein [Streptomyces griseochromogenes]